MSERLEFIKALRQSMTDAERLLWLHLRARRLNGHKFRRQYPLGRYVVDFLHLAARLVIELDGGQHNESLHDKNRDAWLRAQGFEVIRFWNNEVLLETTEVLSAICAAVERRTASPTKKCKR